MFGGTIWGGRRERGFKRNAGFGQANAFARRRRGREKLYSAKRGCDFR